MKVRVLLPSKQTTKHQYYGKVKQHTETGNQSGTEDLCEPLSIAEQGGQFSKGGISSHCQQHPERQVGSHQRRDVDEGAVSGEDVQGLADLQYQSTSFTNAVF